MIEMGNLWLEVSLEGDFAEGSLGVLQLKTFDKKCISKLWRKRTVNPGSFEKLFGFENEISCPTLREFWWYREIMPFVQLWMEGF